MGKLPHEQRVSVIKSKLQANLVSEPRRIESLPRLALKIQSLRQDLQLDPLKFSSSHYELLDITLSTFNFGLRLHMKHARMLNRYLEKYMRGELSRLQKVVDGNPNLGEIRHKELSKRITRTLTRFNVLEKIEQRRVQRERRHLRVRRIPSKRFRKVAGLDRIPSSSIRKVMANPGPVHLADQADHMRKWYLRCAARSRGIQIPGPGSTPRSSLPKTNQTHGLFAGQMKMRLQTLSEKYGNMTWGADLMVEVLEDVVEKSLEDAEKFHRKIQERQQKKLARWQMNQA